MTEAEWLAADDPGKLLNYLRRAKRRTPSDRKLRLFACACCRRIWRFLNDRRSRRAVEMAERYADGEAPLSELERAEGQAWDAAGGEGSGSDSKEAAAWAASQLEGAVWNAPECAAVATLDFHEPDAQAALLRDIAGNPFRPAAPLAPAVLAWNGGTVPKLAAAIYEERAFDRLPVLADALEDAGCTDADILGHCRAGGEHVRGCWVVDLALGKG
jgi:hypothetical protein